MLLASAVGVGLTVVLSTALAREESSAPARLLTADARPTPAAVTPPARLRVSASVPATRVTVGQPVTVTVRWSDGDGVYAGDAAFFGEPDGLGALALSRCSGRRPAGPHAGGSHYTHTFTRPGTYHATFEIDTQSCAGGDEQRTAAVTFVVTATG